MLVTTQSQCYLTHRCYSKHWQKCYLQYSYYNQQGLISNSQDVIHNTESVVYNRGVI